MKDWEISSIAPFAPTPQDFEKLSIGKQTSLLLRRLATLYKPSTTFNRRDMMLGQTIELAHGYPDQMKHRVMEVLCGQPWQELVNQGYIIDVVGNGFFAITSDGYKAAARKISLAQKARWAKVRAKQKT